MYAGCALRASPRLPAARPAQHAAGRRSTGQLQVTRAAASVASSPNGVSLQKGKGFSFRDGGLRVVLGAWCASRRRLGELSDV